MPQPENKVEKTSTETVAMDTKAEETNQAPSLSIGEAAPVQDKDYSEYLSWKEEQKAQKAQEALLAPLGTMDDFNETAELIKSSGNVDLRNRISTKLESTDPMQQALGIAEMAAYRDAVRTIKQNTEEPVMNSPLPGIGASTAPTSSNPQADQAQLPEVNLSDTLFVDGIKNPRVKAAAEKMYEKFDELVEKHGASSALHNLAAEAAFDTVGKLVKTSEKAFGDSGMASEALYVWGRLNDQIRAKADAAGDPSFTRRYENAEKINYQLADLEREKSNGRTTQVNYLEQMFPDKFKNKQ